MGIRLHVAWRDKPTRRGFSLIDSQGERAMTVIGERLAPTHKDNLEWNILKKMDGIFITASDSCLLYTSPSPRDAIPSRMPSSA